MYFLVLCPNRYGKKPNPQPPKRDICIVKYIYNIYMYIFPPILSVHLKHCAHRLWFVVLCLTLVPVDFTYILYLCTRSSEATQENTGKSMKRQYRDVIMGAIASQITSLAIVYSAFYSGADQRKHQSFVSLAFMRGIHRGPHKWPVTRKMFPFDDVIMRNSWKTDEITRKLWICLI